VIVHHRRHCIVIGRIVLRWRPLRRRWPLAGLWESMCYAVRRRIAMMFHVRMRAVRNRRRRVCSWLRWGCWSPLRVG
jgi:hypothetical protein